MPWFHKIKNVEIVHRTGLRLWKTVSALWTQAQHRSLQRRDDGFEATWPSPGQGGCWWFSRCIERRSRGRDVCIASATKKAFANPDEEERKKRKLPGLPFTKVYWKKWYFIQMYIFEYLYTNIFMYFLMYIFNIHKKYIEYIEKNGMLIKMSREEHEQSASESTSRWLMSQN